MQGFADRDRVVDAGGTLDDVVDIAFCQLRALRNLFHNLAVVVGNAQLLCQSLAELPPAAAELSANGNDLIHRNPP